VDLSFLGIANSGVSNGLSRLLFLHHEIELTARLRASEKLRKHAVAFAEFERSLIKERQREGIALAKKAGVYKGPQAIADHRESRRTTQAD
jgi:DNA invertase Pin-like site-specific DNA recombinase